jgi:hypothetical protein
LDPLEQPAQIPSNHVLHRHSPISQNSFDSWMISAIADHVDLNHYHIRSKADVPVSI